MANLRGLKEVKVRKFPDEANRIVDTISFSASTVHGIMKVSYEYVPSVDLLASANKVAATEKNKRAAQLPAFLNADESSGSLPLSITTCSDLKFVLSIFMTKGRLVSTKWPSKKCVSSLFSNQ